MRHNSNDGQRNAILIRLANGNWIVDLFADRLSARKGLLRGKLVDHNRSRAIVHVLRSEISSAQNRHAKRGKVVRRNKGHLTDWLLAVRIGRRAGNVE